MTPEAQQAIMAPEPVPPVAVLEHLTGPMRGTVTWVAESDLNVTLDTQRRVHLSAKPAGAGGGELVAHLRRTDGGYEIDTTGARPIWVNGKPIRSRRLENYDMIEFCQTGPMSRFCLYSDGRPPHRSLAKVLRDAAAYVRSSRRSPAMRIASAMGQVCRRLAGETTILFRIGVIIALAGLVAVAYQQSRINMLLRQQIETSAAQIEGFSRTLARVREEALTPGDLETLRLELGKGMATTAERVSELERRSTASARIIAQSASSVVFLQGAYGFRQRTTGRMLRQVVDEDGKPLILPNGIPLLSLEGDGPVAERKFTGTGFVVGDDGVLITNKHVGLPWEHDVNVTALASQELEPVMIKFIAYLPGIAKAEGVELVRTSEVADVAILRFLVPEGRANGLRLAEQAPEPGDEVIVMGYPTGLRSMLAQAGEGFIKELQAAREIDFWSVAARLAAAGRIIPLASRGIVGRASEETIVYDAETTYGGSGGPVLDRNGEVVAVNAAILPEYGGSNLGVPIDKIRPLLGQLPPN